MMKKRVPATILCFIAFVVGDESKREIGVMSANKKYPFF
jgi:hypothetical protein